MYRAKRLYLLLGVLVVVCAAAFLALRMEERQEQIQNSGEPSVLLAAVVSNTRSMNR